MLLYNLGIFLYRTLLAIASPFHAKAKKMLQGRKDIFTLFQKFSETRGNSKVIWFHAASLGEFEQGRPLIEAIRKKHPEYKILLTFFSPSGYEVQKNYSAADLVTYIPFDFPSNAKKFIGSVKPDVAIFIKYEFWLNFLTQLEKRNIPVYLVSAVFHRNQPFFKWYGETFVKALKTYKHIFAQDKDSAALLQQLNISAFSISGDTRYDRVLEILEHKKNIPALENFSSGKFVIVMGSSYREEEEMMFAIFRELKKVEPQLALLIAPHEINPENISRLGDLLDSSGISFSLYSDATKTGSEAMIFNTMGMLSSAYRYGNIAVIGGGFRDGIHNILEPSVYGLPVLFGPNYPRFVEARELHAEKGAYEFHDSEQLLSILKRLLSDKKFLENTSAIASTFVKKNAGATEKVLSVIQL